MRPLKIAFSTLFILLVSFFVVKSCVHPKRAPYREEPVSSVPFFSQWVKPRPIVIAPRQPEAPLPPAVKQPEPVPHIAIILDDWGKNYGLLKTAVEMRRPLTLAIIPHLSKSRQIAEEAHQSGLGVMLHLPMEPFNKKEPLEPHTILTGMKDAEIVKILDAAVDAVPHLEGVNNHMGSAATSDARVMKTVLSRLKTKNLFFVDSHVVATSQAGAAAKEAGIRFASRDVFIDNENKLEAIKVQLEKAKKIALSRGEAVVIGHDRRLTLQAIREMLPIFDKAGVKLVFAEDIVKTIQG